MLPEQKLYLEQKLQAEQQRSVTVKQAGEVSRSNLGRENVNGIDCDKYEVTVREGRRTAKMYQWVSDDQWPVRSAAVDGSWSTDFKNIRKGDQPDVLFSVPEGFNKMKLPSMKAPPGMNPSNLYRNMKELPDQN
jgi:hypothetical protein